MFDNRISNFCIAVEQNKKKSGINNIIARSSPKVPNHTS